MNKKNGTQKNSNGKNARNLLKKLNYLNYLEIYGSMKWNDNQNIVFASFFLKSNNK